MAKYKKTEDYYVKSNLEVKTGVKDVVFTINAGSLLKFSGEQNGFYNFNLINTPLTLKTSVEKADIVVATYIDEIDRNVALEEEKRVK